MNKLEKLRKQLKEQAVERCGTKQGNKGFAVMQSAVEMANVMKKL